MTNCVVQASNKNQYIANDYYNNRLNNTAYTRSQQMFRRRPKSTETVLKEQIEKSYTSRSNICDQCHMTKSRIGTCEC